MNLLKRKWMCFDIKHYIVIKNKADIKENEH